MKTFNLMLRLSEQRNKVDYITLLGNELNQIVADLTGLGYNVTAQQGLVGRHSMNINDLYLYQYFRDVHFIYWGLQNNQWNNDPIDELYYRGLEGFVSTQYQKLP